MEVVHQFLLEEAEAEGHQLLLVKAEGVILLDLEGVRTHSQRPLNLHLMVREVAISYHHQYEIILFHRDVLGLEFQVLKEREFH